VLRLSDWDIRIRMQPADWPKSGDILADLEDKKAFVLINECPVSDRLEQLVVHELLHIELCAMDQMLEALFPGAAWSGSCPETPWGQRVPQGESRRRVLLREGNARP